MFSVFLFWKSNKGEGDIGFSWHQMTFQAESPKKILENWIISF